MPNGERISELQLYANNLLANSYVSQDEVDLIKRELFFNRDRVQSGRERLGE